MYNNIGRKIKILARIICIIGIIISIILGLLVLPYIEYIEYYIKIDSLALIKEKLTESLIECIKIIVLGSLISWISSFCLYGFGQLIENSDKAVELLSKNNTINKTNEHVNNSTPTNPPKSNNNYEDKSLEETIPDVF